MKTLEKYNLEEFYGRFFSWRGIAVRIVEREIEDVSEFQNICSDEFCDCVEDYCYQEIWTEQFTGNLIVVMIGDDKKHIVDFSELKEITSDNFCHECGQIGCGY